MEKYLTNDEIQWLVLFVVVLFYFRIANRQKINGEYEGEGKERF